MNERFYVYIIFRLDGSPAYVGKGTGNRWRQHGYRGRDSNPRLVKLINDSGGSLPTVIIRRGLSDEVAKQTERAFIQAIGRGRDGPLVNLTDGGEGLIGMIMPQEIRDKISAAHKGVPKSEQHRANISASRKARFAALRESGVKIELSAEHRAAISAGNMGKTISPQHREAVGSSKRGVPLSPEHRAKIGSCFRGLRQTPEQVAKRVASTARTKALKVSIGLGNSIGF